VGCGNIAPIYLKNLSAFLGRSPTVVADLDPARAQRMAAEFGIAKATDLEGVLSDPEVSLVLNLTTPLSHFDVAKRSLLAG